VPPEAAPAPALPALDTPYWKALREKRLLVVGVCPGSPPFAMPAAGGGVLGIDVELARLLGRSLGVGIQLVALKAADRLSALEEGRVDVLLAALTMTADRALRANFARPYLKLGQAALVQRALIPDAAKERETDVVQIEHYDDLAKLGGLSIGVQADTLPETLARRRFTRARIVAFPDQERATEALLRGEVGAVVGDSPYVHAWKRVHGVHKIVTLAPSQEEEALAAAIRKGDLEFLRWLDVFFETAEADGTLRALERRYLNDEDWVELSVWKNR